MSEVRGDYDVLFDNLIDYLRSYATAESAVDSLRNYSVFEDFYTTLPADPGAYVFPTLGAITPDRSKSSSQAYMAYDVDYPFDLIVKGRATRSGSVITRADAAAGARLRYLIQQMLNAIHSAPWDMGLPRGSIASRPMMRFEPLPPDMQKSEESVIGARMTLTVGMAWKPIGPVGTALESVYVDASQWKALYEQE